MKFWSNPNRHAAFINSFHKANPPVPITPQVITPPPTYTSEDTIAQLIINKIIQHNGIGSNVYGVPGSAWYSLDKDLQNAIDSQKLNYIPASNESSGIFMSAYEAEINRTVGVHFCTSGPGTTMATTAMGNMLHETKPCIVFLGVAVTNFQYIDMSIMTAVSKKVIYIDKNTINPQGLLDDAFEIAQYGTTEFPGQGPVAVFVNNSIWNLKYTYNDNIIRYSKKINPVADMLNKIYSSIYSNPKVILRVGERVSIDNIKLLADLTNTNKNVYLHLTVLSKTYINSFDYKNVGIEGPMGNQIINANYANASVVIDIGTGVEYSLINYLDEKPMMAPNTSIFYIMDQYLQYFDPGSNSSNTLMTDVNFFVTKFISDFNNNRYSIPTSNLWWPDTKESQNTYFISLLNKYKTQSQLNPSNSQRILTTASIVAQILTDIYKQQPTNKDAISKMLIDDNTIYSTDIGTCSFIFDSLLYHSRINHNLNFCEFSAIGSSLAALAGRLATDKFDDAVCVMGDGGFLNVPGYLIDLTNVLRKFPNKRCLFIMLNDNRYTNVALGEQSKFGQFTSITSTSMIQQNISMFDLCKTLMGYKFVNSISLTDITSVSSGLSTFVTNWYNKAAGFTQGGFYLIYYETHVGTPFIMT